MSSISDVDSGFGSLSRQDSLNSISEGSEILQEFEEFKNQKHVRLESFSKGKMSLEIFSYGQSSQSEKNLKKFLEIIFLIKRVVSFNFFCLN